MRRATCSGRPWLRARRRTSGSASSAGNSWVDPDEKFPQKFPGGLRIFGDQLGNCGGDAITEGHSMITDAYAPARASKQVQVAQQYARAGPLLTSINNEGAGLLTGINRGQGWLRRLLNRNRTTLACLALGGSKFCRVWAIVGRWRRGWFGFGRWRLGGLAACDGSSLIGCHGALLHRITQARFMRRFGVSHGAHGGACGLRHFGVGLG